MLDLVRSVRNRIAHDGSSVGSDLAELAASKENSHALAAFRARYAKGAPLQLPELEGGKPPGLQVVHAILFGLFLYEAEKKLKDYAARLTDDNYFSDMQ